MGHDCYHSCCVDISGVVEKQYALSVHPFHMTDPVQISFSLRIIHSVICTSVCFRIGCHRNDKCFLHTDGNNKSEMTESHFIKIILSKIDETKITRHNMNPDITTIATAVSL